MAMTMNGEYQLPVARETVWEKLNDAETLKACIPGCESLDKLSDTEFQAVAVTKIGPVKAKFKGKVTLSDLDPPNGYKISGQGDGGVAGFATGGATVKLEPKDGGTLLILTESGFDAIPKDRRIEAFRMNERGWTEQMKNIARHLAAHVEHPA